MSHVVRIGVGVSAAALAIALGFAFWPQFDKSIVSAKAAVEKPVFVTPAAPAKPAVSAAAPASAPVKPAVAAAASSNAPAVVKPLASAPDGDPALTKLAMALRANTQTSQPTASDLGATRGLVIGAPATPVASDGARRLCAQGLVAFAQGNIASARAYLQAAADAGDARALLALGETYDPATLARIGARGIKGDLARARDYYSQALAAGVGDARERLAAVAASSSD